MDKQLIFDLGFYNGDTSLQYLRDGFKVIGVDCNPRLKFNNREIEQFLKDGLLKIEKNV